MTERTWSDGTADGADALPGIVIAQADLVPATAAEGLPGAPRALVEAEAVVPAEPPATAAAEVPTAIDVAPLAAGERRVVEVPPGSTVTLGDATYDPADAVYAVDGFDLVVTLPNGGVLVLVGFFAPGEAPPQLSVLGAPATTAPELLQRAEAAPVIQSGQAIEPAAGPEGGATPPGGGAGFTPYDQGSIGEGLDPSGPLGPTALAAGASFGIGEAGGEDFFGEANRGPVDPEPTTEPPSISLRSTVSATIGEVTGPAFNPVTTPVLPIRGPGQNIPDDEVNSVDQRNVTLDIDREVFVRFVDEGSLSIDSLFLHQIAADGTITGVRLAFAGLNKPGDRLNDLSETPLGTEVSMGVLAGGTKIGMILLNNGFRLNDFAALEGGSFEVRNAQTGAPAKITDFHPVGDPFANPQIVHIADDGTETVLQGLRFFSADASQGSTNNNRLNPDGKGHFVSGWDADEGVLVIGVEDSIGPRGDRDFDDLVFAIRFGSPRQNVLVIDDFDSGLEAVITDPDSTEMVAATIALAGLAGDRLLLDPAIADGTGIVVNRVSDTLIELSGTAAKADYEKVISAASIAIDLDDPKTGDRVVTVEVTDPDGNTGSSATTFVVDDALLAGTDPDAGAGAGDGVPDDGDGNGDGDGPGGGTDGNDVLIGTSSGEPGTNGNDVISGRGGDDRIFPRSGNDFIDGGDGDDYIDARNPGEKIIIGGPGRDHIILGPGADTVRITGLGDGADRIERFNATEGDRLDLTDLLRDTDVTSATLDRFVRLSPLDSDGDGRADTARVQVDLDAEGSLHRPVTIAYLERPIGVTVGSDPASYITVADSEPAVS